jgi:phosphate transport system substrate-binding protein
MRKLLLVLLALSFFNITGAIAAAQEQEPAGTLTLSGAWAIYPTAVAWAAAFQKKYPRVRVDVSAGGAGKGAADAIAGLVDIGMVSREPDPAEIKKGITPVYILHDAVFAVINKKNPALEKILKTGVKKQTFADFWVSGLITSWDQVSSVKVNKPIHLYTRSDSCGAAASWAANFGKKQDDLKGIGVYGDPGLLEAVKKDPLGIGYNNFSYVFTREGKVVEGVRLVPIDANANGKADADEIAANRADAVRFIESGKYPAARRNYFFVKGTPNGLIKEFIAFALSEEGAKIVDEVGASLPLPDKEREKVLRGL